MGGYRQALQVEAAGVCDILDYLQRVVFHGKVVTAGQGDSLSLSLHLQKTVGDFVANDENGNPVGLELKVEQHNRHGNFFLETWSNRIPGGTLGWMLTLKSDVLLYYFLSSRKLYKIDFRKLWQWAFVQQGASGNAGRIWDFPERPQGAYMQRNATFGRCVPIIVIEREVGFTQHDIPDRSSRPLVVAQTDEDLPF